MRASSAMDDGVAARPHATLPRGVAAATRVTGGVRRRVEMVRFGFREGVGERAAGVPYSRRITDCDGQRADR